MGNKYLARQPREYDKDKILSEIDLRECTPPTRKRIQEIAQKEKLTIDEQIYLAVVRDYLKLSGYRRKVISSKPIGSFKLRLERERSASRSNP